MSVRPEFFILPNRDLISVDEKKTTNETYTRNWEKYSADYEFNVAMFRRIKNDYFDSLSQLNNGSSELPMEVLVIGSGMGRDTAWFAQEGWKVDVVEYSESFLQVLPILGPNIGTIYKVWLEQLILENLLKKKYDLIHVESSLQHLNHYEVILFLDYVANYIKDGGHIFLRLKMFDFYRGGSVYKVASELGDRFGVVWTHSEVIFLLRYLISLSLTPLQTHVIPHADVSQGLPAFFQVLAQKR